MTNIVADEKMTCLNAISSRLHRKVEIMAFTVPGNRKQRSNTAWACGLIEAYVLDKKMCDAYILMMDMPKIHQPNLVTNTNTPLGSNQASSREKPCFSW